ncbi:MAG: O-antigen ligase family protein [Lachnospiraceae bacterium]|nr:O-antigen ligase family protein [Lachnospiraceae bacterium]
MASKNKKKKKQDKTAGQQAAEYFTKIIIGTYVFLMLCVYPLFFRLDRVLADGRVESHRYFDMGDTKFAFFQWVSYLFLGLMIFAALFYAYAFNRNSSFFKAIKSLSLTDRFAAAYFFACWLSFLFAEDKEMALFGFQGWNMGFISQVFFLLALYFVSRFWQWSPTTLMCAVAAAALTHQMGIIQRFKFDPLGMYVNVTPESVEKFVSTLGQTTWYSSYSVLIIPLGMYFYWSDERLWMRIASAMYIALAFGMLVTTNSDSAYVAVVLIFMVFFRYSLESNGKMKRFLEMAAIGLLSMQIIGLMRMLFPGRTPKLITGDEKITEFATRSPVFLVALLLVIAMYLLLCRSKGFDISEHRKIIWKGTLTAAGLVLGGVLIAIIAVTFHLLPESIIPADSEIYKASFFMFNDRWGNHRGFNWRMSVKALRNIFSNSGAKNVITGIKDLLVGNGPDCFEIAMEKYCQPEVSIYWKGLKLACAHNEFLNLLVTGGILGTVSYVGIMVTCFKECASVVKKEPAVIPFMAAIPAYMGHNFFCYQQCICTPVLFILMGVGLMIVRSVRKEEAQAENK